MRGACEGWERRAGCSSSPWRKRHRPPAACIQYLKFSSSAGGPAPPRGGGGGGYSQGGGGGGYSQGGGYKPGFASYNGGPAVQPMGLQQAADSGALRDRSNDTCFK